MDKDLTKLPISDFNNSEIIGSCFYQQVAPDTQVFPSGIIGTKFTRCNLDNVLIPPGNIIEFDCCHRKIKIQNDLEDWVVDSSLKPIEPVNRKIFERLGLSIDPKDIPIDFIRKEIVVKAEWLRTKDLPEVTDWYLENPQIISQETRQSMNIVLKEKWDSLSNKGFYTDKYDEFPSIIAGITNKDEKAILITGNITQYTIEGKGVIIIQGRKSRPFVNLSVTFAKEQELAEAI